VTRADDLPHTEDDLEAWYREIAPWRWLGGPRRIDTEDRKRIAARKRLGERCRS
jgi:hypothetical protein